MQFIQQVLQIYLHNNLIVFQYLIFIKKPFLLLLPGHVWHIVGIYGCYLYVIVSPFERPICSRTLSASYATKFFWHNILSYYPKVVFQCQNITDLSDTIFNNKGVLRPNAPFYINPFIGPV